MTNHQSKVALRLAVALLASGAGGASAAVFNLTATGTFRYTGMDGALHAIRALDYDVIEVALPGQVGPAADQEWGSIAEVAAGVFPKRTLDFSGRINGGAGLPMKFDNVAEPTGIETLVKVNLATDQNAKHWARLVNGVAGTPGATSRLFSDLLPGATDRTNLNAAGGYDMSHSWAGAGGAAIAGEFNTIDALVTGADYANHLDTVVAFGAVTPYVLVNQPRGATFAHTDAGGNRYMSIARERRFSWDSILHEFGHVVAGSAGFDNSPGGGHTAEGNLRPVGGGAAAVENARRLAWSEGYAHFFANAAQDWANGQGRLPAINEIAQLVLAGPGAPTASAPGLALAATTSRYTAFDADAAMASQRIGFTFDLENETATMHRTPRGGALGATVISRGEFNEVSNGRIVWDLMDGTGGAEGRKDQVTLGHDRLWRLLSTPNAAIGGGRPDTLSKMWRVMRADAFTNAPGANALERFANGVRQTLTYANIFSTHRAAPSLFGLGVLPAAGGGGAGAQGITITGEASFGAGAFRSGEDGVEYSDPGLAMDNSHSQRAFRWRMPGHAEADDLFSLQFFDADFAPIDVAAVSFFSGMGSLLDLALGVTASDLGVGVNGVARINTVRSDASETFFADGNPYVYWNVVYASLGVDIADGYWSEAGRFASVPAPGPIALLGGAALCVIRRKRS